MRKAVEGEKQHAQGPGAEEALEHWTKKLEYMQGLRGWIKDSKYEIKK